MKKIIMVLSFVFMTSCMVSYQKHTGIPECDVAIMLAKLKSKKGNAAFEISKYLDKCYEQLKEKKDKK